jgi:gliding motility-associated-like protein
MAKNELLIKDGLCNIYFPNAFTPNQDGKNDRFAVFTDYTLQSFQLTIYNRWGQKIFESTDQNKGWDGYANGKLQETGVFAWSCRFKKSNTTSEMKGTVVLIR